MFDEIRRVDVSRSILQSAVASILVAQLCLGGCSSQVDSKKATPPAVQQSDAAPIPFSVFVELGFGSDAAGFATFDKIRSSWRNEYVTMLLESYQFIRNRRLQMRVEKHLEQITGIRYNGDVNRWFEWLWKQPLEEASDYSEFKKALYEHLDPSFSEYFDENPAHSIRLDEVRWGGVKRDGIPPLKNPKMIQASEATWLEEDNVVFGVELNGDARTYPKRILAWHEMFKDQIGGIEVNGVYCTLCGSLVIYDTNVDGVHYELGTSGFLYRSNKLMYDHETKSLWSTLTGTPVIGPLVGKGIRLTPLYVVTTTWREWRQRHPTTTVLSMETGHRVDYGEGVAYRDYFSNDELMFSVPEHDDRLPNKAEVLAFRTLDASECLAISADFLRANPVYHDQIAASKFVVLTDVTGANRAYEENGDPIVDWDPATNTAQTSSGEEWRVTEAQLVGPEGKTRARFPAHRAFWFGWHAAFPSTRLVK